MICKKPGPKTEPPPWSFYCNGTTCAKSYKAAEEAMEAGFANVFCYDAGINAWVNSCPEKVDPHGTHPCREGKTHFGRGVCVQEESITQSSPGWPVEPNTLVIDIREPFQRAKDPQLPQNKMLTIPNVRNIPSDRLVELLKAGQFKGQQLLLTDAVGKQVALASVLPGGIWLWQLPLPETRGAVRCRDRSGPVAQVPFPGGYPLLQYR